ncbi:MAG: family 10 glycosylhydrolase [Balneola sp.]
MIPRVKNVLLIALFLCSISPSLYGQQNNLKYETRGVWIATVINLDWPSSPRLSVALHKEDLTNKIQKLKENGINTIFFQIRSEGDALYQSDIEPWSKYLTNEEGTAPSPLWDPLQYAIDEAHKRGMELHAWLNPYRAMRIVPSDFTQKRIDTNIDESLAPFLEKEFTNRNFKYKGTTERDSLHIANKNPDWLIVTKGNDPAIAFMDPGLQSVIDYNLKVMMDVVNRYDIDGIHFDDYFYPYPQNHLGLSDVTEALDDSSFAINPRGFTDKDDWRRDNVDVFVETLHDSIQVVKPWVKFGISPFGIWKSGTPIGIFGLSAYDTIYGDAIAWLQNGTVDYIAPQLYWEFGGGQDYAKLANWWAEQANEYDRHLYTGNAAYRADPNTGGSRGDYSANEIPRQIRFNRNNADIKGNILFRMRNLTNFNTRGLSDSLKSNLNKFAALPPIMNWKNQTKPNAPENLAVSRSGEAEYIFEISWDKPSGEQISKVSNSGHIDSLIKYAVYRVDSGSDPDEVQEMEKYYNLIAVTGETTYRDATPPSENGYWYFVTTVSRNNVESEPTQSAEGGVVVSNENDALDVPDRFSLAQNYPNPFNPSTEIAFVIPESGATTLKVYDILGREVKTLINKKLASGAHSVSFDASSLASGIYIYRLSSGNSTLIKRMTLIK